MIDIAIVARDLKLPPEQVSKTLKLLDDGNTIPFITRFRKDETGGLNEEQIQAIRQRATSLRALDERKAFVIKSIDSQGQLTDELKARIDKADTSQKLEDVYLPFKPRKKSRAQEARQKGLGPLAEDIFEGKSPEVDLATRATDFVRVDKGLNSVDEVIQGVGDLLAERFANDAELRNQLRKIILDTGKITAASTAPPEEQKSTENASAENAKKEAAPPAAESAKPETPAVETPTAPAAEASTETPAKTPAGETPAPVAEATSETKTESAAPAPQQLQMQRRLPPLQTPPNLQPKPNRRRKRRKRKRRRKPTIRFVTITTSSNPSRNSPTIESSRSTAASVPESSKQKSPATKTRFVPPPKPAASRPNIHSRTTSKPVWKIRFRG